MDCKKIAFRPESIDKILLVAVLHHLASDKNRIQALKECYKILKNKGSIYISVFCH